jgi:hypothetical protein
MLFLAAGLGFTACSGGTLSTDAPRKGTAEARPSATQNSLSAVGEEEARALAESGHLADLQWLNFSQHRDALLKNSSNGAALDGWWLLCFSPVAWVSC